jgi:hypothetical protein
LFCLREATIPVPEMGSAHELVKEVLREIIFTMRPGKKQKNINPKTSRRNKNGTDQKVFAG